MRPPIKSICDHCHDMFTTVIGWGDGYWWLCPACNNKQADLEMQLARAVGLVGGEWIEHYQAIQEWEAELRAKGWDAA